MTVLDRLKMYCKECSCLGVYQNVHDKCPECGNTVETPLHAIVRLEKENNELKEEVEYLREALREYDIHPGIY